MRIGHLAWILVLCGSTATAQTTSCNLQDWKSIAGVTVTASRDVVEVSWPGEQGQQNRARFALRNGQPIVAELAARKPGGAWIVLGKDLQPDFQVTTGRRRISTTELDILKKLNNDTPEAENEYKWNVFWDAPLEIPGHDSHLVGPGRTPDEVKRAAVSYHSDTCRVKSDGDRVSIVFNGLTLGIFAGDLQFTAYKGSNLLRQEAVAKTDAPDVAYIYKAGLKGFSIDPDTKLEWRDDAQVWQEYDFGGDVNEQPVDLQARNRLEILDAGSGSVAIFPSPHKFFFARERSQPRLRLLPQGQRQLVLPRRDAARARPGLCAMGRLRRSMEPARARGAPANLQLRALQRASRHRAAHGCLLLPECRRFTCHAAAGNGLHARRHLQAAGRLQNRHRPLPSRPE
jgi:hypothetical protein